MVDLLSLGICGSNVYELWWGMVGDKRYSLSGVNLGICARALFMAMVGASEKLCKRVCVQHQNDINCLSWCCMV